MRLDMTGAPWGSSHSEPVRAGGLLFVSGQVPRDSEGRAVCVGDIVGQTRYVFDKLAAVLSKAGRDLGDLVVLRTYLVSRDTLPGYLTTRAEFLTSRPVCTTVFVAGLSDTDFLLEVEAVADAEGRRTG
ncbi:RidA family protein [Actinomadura sp.]|uniref:RidA family protein n=1 Tax=Actinomadura sp. TaxID=1989 RepID=UPI0037C9E0FC